MIVKILLALVLFLVCVVAYAFFTAPKVSVVSRSLLINAPVAKIFPYANNPKAMQEWNPFTENDPTLKMTYSGPAEGVGAQSAWDGNSNSGKGQATVTESELNKRVAVRLDFEKPFAGVNYGEYRFEPQGDGTLFTWTIEERSLFPRMMSRILNLDKMIGTKFEKGMANLKAIVEK